MDNLVGFELWLAQKGRKVGTVRTTSYNVKRVLRSCTLSEDSIASYLFSLQQKGLRHAYLNNLIDGLRMYGQYQGIEYLVNFPYFKDQTFVKATLSDEEIERFLGIPCPQAMYLRGTKTLSPSWVRWNKMTVFWSICAYSGMRMGEVASLTIDSVDWGRNVFILEDTKTNTPRNVPIAPNIKGLLEEYTKNVDKYLFPSARGGTHKGVCMDSVDWGYDFHLRMNKLGIRRKNLSPYSLRHSLITRLLEEDVNIFKVQKIVGHRRLDTTAQYTHMTTKDIQEAIKKHPLVRRATTPQDILKALSETIKGFQLEKDPRFTFDIHETENSLEVTVKLRA